MSDSPARQRGTRLYRVKMRATAGEKSEPWYQVRLLGFLWWVWHSPVDNELNRLRWEFVSIVEKLDELRLFIAAAEKEQKQVVADVQGSGLGISTHPLRALRRPKETRVPDAKKAYDEAVLALRGGRRHRRPDGIVRSPEDGTRSSYILEDKFPISTYNRSKLGEDNDHVIRFQEPREQQQQQGRKNRGQQNKGGGGGQNDDRTINISLGDVAGNSDGS